MGSNVGAPTNVELYSCSGWSETGGEVVYELVLPGPTDYIIHATVDPGGCDLDIFLLASCDEGDCLDYGDTSLTFGPVPPGTYYIVVDGYDGAECPFTLTVACDEYVDPCCPLLDTCVSFDFNDSDHGFWTLPCGGAPVWDWVSVPTGSRQTCDGQSAVNLLGTGPLDEDYPPESGEIAVLGPVQITEDCWCMELCHIYFIEIEWDGGNVKVSDDQGASWDLVRPARGYDNTAGPYAMCVAEEPTFAAEPSPWVIDCFDLTGYTGSEILIGFFFGSDDTVQGPGWFIRWVKIGTGETAVESTSWGVIKALYR
jgi:hypothetical protein